MIDKFKRAEREICKESLRKAIEHNNRYWRKQELVDALNRNPNFHFRATMF